MRRSSTVRSFAKRSRSIMMLALVLPISYSLSAQTFPSPYCDVTFDYDVEPITLVNVAGINNTSSATINGTPAVQNFLSIQGNMTIGQTYPCVVKGNTGGSWTDYIRVYIDWNQDNDFDDPNESYDLGSIYNSSGTDAVQASGNIAVPATATPGTTRMRVFKDYDDYPTDACTSSYGFGQVEDYTIIVSGGVSCSTITFPASGTTQASPGSLCVSGNVTLGFTPVTAIPPANGITYQWQSSASASGPWTNIGTPTTVPSYTTTISSTSYFRCQVLCNGSPSGLTGSASTVVTVNNPGSPSPVAGSHCGPGIVSLSATAPAGSSISWYQNATGGIPLATGGTYAPFVPVTTTYYTAAVAGSTSVTPQIGTATSILPSYTTGGPFTNTYRNEAIQMLYTAAEITAAGGGPGAINSIAFNCKEIPLQVNSPYSPTAFPNYRIAVATVPSSVTTLTSWEPNSNFATVYTNTSFLPVLGWNTFTLSAPLNWNGSDNLIIQVCYDQTQPSYSGGSSYSTAGKHEYTSKPNRLLYYYDDYVSTSCGETGSDATSYLPNVRFGMTLPCEGPRVPVTATITTPPVFTKTAPDVVCNDAVGTLTVTSPAGNYSSYVWSPAAELFTDPAATVPYTGGSATTLYFKSATVGQHSFSMYATNTAAPNCSFADTSRIWVQPQDAAITAIFDTLCQSGTSDLSLEPGTGYALGSIQWQESANGVTFNDISGANTATYTTPTLTASHYYRALINSDAGNCLSPEKYVVVSDPTVLTTKDSFHCAPGEVVLEATSDPTSVLRWYDSPTATQPIGTGSPFTTPFLGTTTDFYVAAGTGTPQPEPSVIGNGTFTTDWSAMPYCNAYNYGNKVQWLITASEMQSQGFSAGYITALGFTVGSYVGDACENFTLSMKNIPSGGLGSGFQTGLQTVFSVPSYQPVDNTLNTHVLQTPFHWDGTSDIVVEECHVNSFMSYSYTAVEENTSGQCLYNSAYNPAPAQCSNPNPNNTYSTNDRPNITITMRGACESPRQPVTAHIYPKPVVDLGSDINICVDAGATEVLDAGYQPYDPQYLWDNGSVSQVRAVNQDGIYYVQVTNNYTCVGYDTISVTLRDNPVVNLGNDTTVCNGATLTLDAGNQGIDYFWNTGATTQTLTVNSPGSYNVFVTNNKGCTKADTIVVNMQGELPSIQGIQVTNDGQYTFSFTAINPQNVIGYDWDFGDNSAHSYQAAPTHTYLNNGNYIVVLKLSSSCGFLSDSSSAHIVGINQLSIGNDEMTVYPNPSKGSATILNKGALRMERIQVYNVLGQVVYTAKADSRDKHSLDLSSFTSGVYTIEIFTDKGTVPRKLEILK